ncbi:MAG TPA: glucosamine-6-phosphate deaminase [Bryobacteraceae bacterium]|nr:glucosamine-6-phosphate deaminase [Bryobacteraceae bacterium]
MKIHVHENRAELGAAAAEAIATALRRRIAAKGAVTVVFAAAPSQNETLAALIDAPGIDWSAITAFHMDEYVGAKPDSPWSFRRFLREHIFDQVHPRVFNPIQGETVDTQAECRRYGALLPKGGFDIALLGIGENGHLAFNDPPCNFEDPEPIKIVTLDEACRVQQVHDGAFATLDDVPRQAFSLTVPTLIAAHELFVMVPGPAKAAAVRASVEGPVTNQCPASILRQHPRAELFLDRDSASRLTT